jgi:hypothetical protein
VGLKRWTVLPASTDPGSLQEVEGRSYSDLLASPWRMDLGLELVAGLEKQLQRPKVSQQAQKQDPRTGQVRQQRWEKVMPVNQRDRLTVG